VVQEQRLDEQARCILGLTQRPNPTATRNAAMARLLQIHHLRRGVPEQYRSRVVEISSPSFRLREPRCPCLCGGEGLLTFITCSGCCHVTVACDEVGTVFVSPRDLSELSGASWLSGFEDGLCPHCRDVSLRDFRFSTGEEIQALGFSPTEYV